MLQYPKFDPIIFQIGPFAPRWYGLMYLIGFIFTYRQLQKNWRWLGLRAEDQVDSVLGILVLSMLVCSRLVYVVFYNFQDTMAGPWWEIFAVWHGGLAFHGGLLGVVVGAVIVSYRYKLHWLRLTDVVSSIAPIGLGFGRIGNFINGELWGRVTEVPWGMVFPGAGPYPRHPSQLYQSLLEGLLLYIIMSQIWKRKPLVGVTSGLFLIIYAVFRIFAELFREPDSQIGFIFGFFTMGQLLSAVMLLSGCAVFFYARKQKIAH
jgi:phosphatidylglycerol---prolipoprotein diacylglyceryl transferase